MTQSELLIRPMTEDDLPRVLELEQRCFPDPWTEGVFRSSLADELELWLVCEADGLVLGYLGMQSVLDEGYIDNLCVDPAFRRRRLGTRLLTAAEHEAKKRNLSLLSLEVRAGNEPAIALYTRFGFETLGIRPGYYLRPKEDARIMTKYYDKVETQ